MAESSIIVSIGPSDPKAPQPPKRFKLPTGIREVLAGHQDRIYEARAVAFLLNEHLVEPSGAEAAGIDVATRAIEEAVSRLLAPIEGLDDPLHLVAMASALEKDNG